MSDPQYSSRGPGRSFARRYSSWFYYDILTDLSARLETLESQRLSHRVVPIPERMALARNLLTALESEGLVLSGQAREEAVQHILYTFELLSPTP